MLVNRPIKAACGVERQKEKLERLPTSNKAGASAGVASSTVHGQAPGAASGLDIYHCIISSD